MEEASQQREFGKPFQTKLLGAQFSFVTADMKQSFIWLQQLMGLPNSTQTSIMRLAMRQLSKQLSLTKSSLMLGLATLTTQLQITTQVVAFKTKLIDVLTPYSNTSDYQRLKISTRSSYCLRHHKVLILSLHKISKKKFSRLKRLSLFPQKVRPRPL